MSKEVDQRVVEMRFDNKQFESNVQTTMSTLDKLKQKLHFKDVNKSISEVNMSPMTKGLDTVQAKFSAMQVVAATALANITNSTINAGKKMMSALTIDPIKTGFQEYETQMNAVQTILANTASKGSTLKDVNGALDELNTYADKTIYNFTEMTRNIGTFTAAGIDLETSVNSIQGIANLAAVSGSTSQQASTAMYQLSQALAAGTVKLMDWNSVVNAGMGGEMFQNALKETSKELGTGAEAAIKASGSFRESLKDGWLTAEVLTATLKKFTTSGANEYVAKYTGLSTEAVEAALKEAEARYGEADAIEKASEALAEKSGKNKDEIKSALQFAKNAEDAATKVKTFSQLWDVMKESAQSGWAQTWKLIIGDFEEAKNLLTPLADFFTGIIGKMNDARNKLLEGALGKTFTDLSKKIKGIVDPVKEVTNVVGNITGALKDYNALADEIIAGKWGNAPTRWQDLAAAGYDWAHAQNLVNEKLGDSTRHATKYSEAQKSATDADKSAIDTKTELTKADAKSLEMLCALSDEELRNQGLTEDQIKALRQLQKEADKLGMSVGDFLSQIDTLDGRTILINSFKNIGEGIVKTFKAMADAWKEIFPPMTSEQLYNVIAGFHKLSTNFKMSDETADNLKRTFKGLFAILDIILTVVGGPIKIAFKILGQILGAANVDIFWLTGKIGDAIVKFRDWLDSVLDFTGVFEWMLPYLKKGIETVKEWFISFKNSEAVKNFVKELSAAFKSGAKAVKEWFAGFKDSETLQKLVKIFKHLGETIKGFFSNMNTSGVGENVISGLVNGLKSGVSKVVSTISNIAKSIIDTICNILGIHSPSTVMMAIGGFLIAGLIAGLKSDASGVWGTVKSIGSNLINLAKDTFLKLIDFVKNISLGEVLVIAMTAGLVAGIVKIIGIANSLQDAIEGFGNMCNGAGELMSAFAERINPKKNKFGEASKAILKIAISIGILAASVYILAQLKPAQLWSAVGAITALALVMGALTFAAGKMDVDGGSFKGITKLLLSMAVSFFLLAKVAETIGNMDWSQLGKAGAGMAGLIAFMTALMLISKIGNFKKIGTMLMKMAGALLILALVSKLIAGMDWTEMGKAGAGLGGLVGFMALLMLITKIGNAKKAGAMLMQMAGAILMLTIVGKMIAKMDWSEMGKASVGLGGLVGFMALLMLITKIGNFKKVGSMLLQMSGAIAILAITARMIAGMEWSEMGKAGVGILGLGAIIAGLMWATKLAGGGNLKGVGLTLLMASVAIGILAGIAVLLGMVPIEKLQNGVIAVSILGVLMAMMIAATNGAEKCVGNIVAMSIAIAVMAGAVAGLSFIDQNKLITATVALSVVMGMFALLTKTAGQSQAAIGSLIIMTVALGILSGALYLISGLPVANALAGAAALSMLMLALTGSMVLISKVGNISINTVAALGIMTVALGILSGALYLISGLPIANALAGAAALSVLMLSLSVSMMLISNVGAGAIAGAAALIIIAGALAILTPCLQTLGSMSLAQIGTGLLGLAGAFAVIGVAGLLLGPIAPMILALSVAIAAIGVGCMAAGVGLMTFSLGLQTLAMMGPAGAAAITVLVTTILNLIPMIAVALANGIVQFATTIAAGAVTLANAIVTVVNAIITALVGTIPNLLAAAGVLLTSFLNFIVTYIPKMVDAGMKLIKGILQGIADNIGGIVKAAIDIVVNFINGVSSKIGDVIDAGIKLMISFINGLADGIRNNQDQMIAAINNLMDAVIEAVKAYFSNFSTKGKEIVDKIKEGIKNKISDIKTAGKNVVSGFIKGIGEKIGAVKDKAKELVSALGDKVKKLLGIESPSKVFAGYGKFVDQGLAIGLKKNVKGVTDAAVDVASSAIDGFTDYLGIHSPAKEGINIGKFLTEGFAVGIESLSGIVENAGKNVGSISTKAISEGIKKDMSAEQAAEQKAKNISNAFKNKLSEIDADEETITLMHDLGQLSDDEQYEKQLKLRSDKIANAWAEYQKTLETLGENSTHTKKAYNNYLKELKNLGDLNTEYLNKINTERAESLDRAEQINDLEYEIWSKRNEETATEYEKSEANLRSLAGSYDVASSRLADAEANYMSIMNDATKSAAEIEEAKIKWLEAQSAYLDDQKAYSDAMEEETKRQQKSLTDYVKFMNEHRANLAEMGLSDSEIEEMARKATGYNPNAVRTDNMLANADSAATGFVATFGKSIETGNTEAISGAVTDLVVACVDTIKDQQSKWFEAAAYLVSGFVKGIRENAAQAVEAAASMATQVEQAVTTELEIESPSRVFMRIGRYVDEGLAKGITKYSKIASDATAGLSETVVNSMSDPISRIADAINSDIDSVPTIRPVLDLTNIQNGVNRIDGILGQRTFALANINAGIASSNMDRMNDIASRMESINDSNNSEVVGALGELRSDFGKMVEAIGNMHISMDSKTVVGTLIEKIDNSLGQMANHKGRGN